LIVTAHDRNCDMRIDGGLDPSLTWNIGKDISQVLEFPFMVNAFRAGFIVAVLAGLIGWFVVLRGQAFVGHTLAVVGFPGAAGALLIGINPTVGIFACAMIVAALIGGAPNADSSGYSEESAVTGTVQAFALACGFLFVSLHGGFFGGVNALLFGSFLGITAGQVKLILAVALAAILVLSIIARPLFFSSVDPDVAETRGVPVRGLSITFLVLLGVTATEISKITGSLLVFVLLVVPAATARLWTIKPLMGLAVTVSSAIFTTWFSLCVAYYFSGLPIGFVLASVAFTGYVASNVGYRLRKSNNIKRMRSVA
jgi:zinc/manganese transport system permease protein